MPAHHAAPEAEPVGVGDGSSRCQAPLLTEQAQDARHPANAMPNFG
jgi:hypothetical protein